VNKRILGKVGETIAARYLERRGFSVLARNWTCRWGEIDLVVQNEDLLVFVEVKMRNTFVNAHAFEAINFYKRKSLQRSINIFLASQRVIKPWRFDVLCITKQDKSYKIDYYEYVSLY